MHADVERRETDVNMEEEAELRRLDGIAPGDASGVDDTDGRRGDHADATAEAAAAGLPRAQPPPSGESAGGASVTALTTGTAVVPGAVQRCEQLESKKAFRPAATISGLMPEGGSNLQTKVPKRKDFGEEGEDGDAAHATAMEQFSLKEFGATHVQGRAIHERMSRVGLFGEWMRRNNYGRYVEWRVTHGENGMERCMVAVYRDGSPRVPPDTALREYVLAMGTGDAASRPKGGWADYRNGAHAKVALHGRKTGELQACLFHL